MYRRKRYHKRKRGLGHRVVRKRRTFRRKRRMSKRRRHVNKKKYYTRHLFKDYRTYSYPTGNAGGLISWQFRLTDLLAMGSMGPELATHCNMYNQFRIKSFRVHYENADKATEVKLATDSTVSVPPTPAPTASWTDWGVGITFPSNNASIVRWINDGIPSSTPIGQLMEVPGSRRYDPTKGFTRTFKPHIYQMGPWEGDEDASLPRQELRLSRQWRECKSYSAAASAFSTDDVYHFFGMNIWGQGSFNHAMLWNVYYTFDIEFRGRQIIQQQAVSSAQ
nr:MAG: capsid protein [Cressdnaviricota sp.]